MPTPRKEPSERKVSTGVRLKPDVRAKLEELAAPRRWSISAYIEWLVEQHIAEMDAPSGKPKPSRKRS